MRWNTICFDLDNTLFDHEKAFEHAIMHTFKATLHTLQETYTHLPHVDINEWFQTFKHYSDFYWNDYEDKRLTREEYREKRFNKTMEYYQLPCEENAAKTFHNQYENVVARYSTPFEGVHALLLWLKKQKVSIGVITNGKRRIQSEKMQQLGITQYIPIQHLIVSNEIGVKKPEKSIFDIALETINGDREHALFIGDSWEQDVQGAIAAGWDAVFLDTRKEHKTDGYPPVAHHYYFTETARFLYGSLDVKG
ncbi:putative hydrolase of the HAD superfamily [Alteribacillus persepolensis]|uniref:Putative hydrolase of the HAD superfamily n=1 Tax=Alteribacillus persepolensis TaxID=568899 RepID=A0A1G8CW17_9BACI|nr:HAD family hydrolase [Alteribacillus persepolensis]SDH49534.1 putative hydrolase of the HAD superfamily [Alteribacillus persepolensis]